MKTLVRLLAITLIISALHGQKVTRDFDRSHDFSSMKTFGWVKYQKIPIFRIDEAASDDVTNEALDQLVKELVKKALEKSRYQFVGDSNLDFKVGYLLQARLKLNETSFEASAHGTPHVPYGHWRPFYNGTSGNFLRRQALGSLAATA